MFNEFRYFLIFNVRQIDQDKDQPIDSSKIAYNLTPPSEFQH